MINDKRRFANYEVEQHSFIHHDPRIFNRIPHTFFTSSQSDSIHLILAAVS